MHMWYWAIMVLLILGSIALLCSTFISVKRIRHRTQSGESSPGTESVTRQIRDMIQKRISRRERRDAVQGRTVLWIQRSCSSKKEDSGRLFWKIWIHGRNIASYSMMKWESEEQRGMTIMRSIFHCMRMEEYPSSTV